MVVLLCTFRQGLKLFLHAGASRAAIAAEGLNPEQVGCALGQIADLYKIFLKYEHDVGSHIQVIILGEKKEGQGELNVTFMLLGYIQTLMVVGALCCNMLCTVMSVFLKFLLM